MARKFFLFIMMLIYSAVPVIADTIDNCFPNSDTLYSWAEGGLNIRSAPNLKAGVTGNIPYGEAMLFIAYNDSSNPEEMLFYKSWKKDTLINGTPFKCIDYFQKGWWIKIQYRDITGFVWNGYTSRFKPVEGEYRFLQLIQHNVNLLSEKKFYDEERDISSSYLSFEQGISASGWASKSGNWTYMIPNMGFEEAMLLARKNIEMHFKDIVPGQDACPIEIIRGASQDIVSLYFTNNANWSLRITWSAGSVVISESVWC